MRKRKAGRSSSNTEDQPIHINPEKAGVFTAKAKAAGMSVQAYANKIMNAPIGKYSPQLRKQANFARNAKKFKH